jgi:hypothetical protein
MPLNHGDDGDLLLTRICKIFAKLHFPHRNLQPLTTCLHNKTDKFLHIILSTYYATMKSCLSLSLIIILAGWSSTSIAAVLRGDGDDDAGTRTVRIRGSTVSRFALNAEDTPKKNIVEEDEMETVQSSERQWDRALGAHYTMSMPCASRSSKKSGKGKFITVISLVMRRSLLTCYW